MSNGIVDISKHLENFNIKLNESSSIFVVESRKHFIVDKCAKNLIKSIVQYPSILRFPAVDLKENSTIKFSLCAWLIVYTDIARPLINGMLEAPIVSDSQIEDLAYVCNYVDQYNPGTLAELRQSFIQFYDRLNAKSKIFLIKLLPRFGSDLIDKEFIDVLENNWHEGSKDISLASLEALLKIGNIDALFKDFTKISQIDDLKILADALILRPGDIQLFRLFREKLNISLELSCTSNKRFKLSGACALTEIDIFSHWIRVLTGSKSWPSFDTVYPLDLLSKLTIYALFTDPSHFKSFSALVSISSDQTICTLLIDLIPASLNHCADLLGVLPRPLMKLFTQLLKNKSSTWEVLLALCRLFMDNFLGTSARKSFVNYLASQVENEEVGERCLELIAEFIEKFPESRYICLTLVKSLFDGVDSWNPKLIDPYYSAFTLMARSSDSVMDDLMLILKKQIYSSDPIYKRIGAIGVGVFLRINGAADRIKSRETMLLPDPDDYIFNDQASCSQKPTQSTTPAKTDYQIRIILSLLEEAIKSLTSDQQAILILVKYFSDAYIKLDDELKDWIGDWCRTIFHENFITQVDEDLFKYKYELDEDNPIALKFEESELSVCVPILLEILGKYEKFQNGGSLEGIDALQGCAIQVGITDELSLSKEFKFNFLLINYFRANLNTFSGDLRAEAKEKQLFRLENLVSVQNQLIGVIQAKPAYLSELKFYPSSHAIIQKAKLYNSKNFAVADNSLLDEILKDSRKSENRIKSPTSDSTNWQLFDVTEKLFFKSTLPLSLDVIEAISGVDDPKIQEFVLTELDNLVEHGHYSDYLDLNRMIDCCLNFPLSNSLIEFVVKCKKNISASQRNCLIENCNKAFAASSSVSNCTLIQSVCKLVVDGLESPELIPNPLELIKNTYKSPISGGLKHLLSLPSIDVSLLIEELKLEDEIVPLKNRLVLLKGISQRIVKELKMAKLNRIQVIFSLWAESIQSLRRLGNDKLLLGIVRESQLILDSFLSCNFLKDVEENALLLDGSKERESIILLFKTVQQSTRALQIICNHLKYKATTSKMSSIFIPNLKKTMESVIFRVKEILTKSGCSGAFWMGNLKHRDLEGHELSSQVELLKIEYDEESLSEGSESDSELENESNNYDKLSDDSTTDNLLSKEFISDSEMMHLSDQEEEAF